MPEQTEAVPECAPIECPPADGGATPKKEEEKKEPQITWRHRALLIEMLLLTLSVMATETTISPALPRLTEQYPEHADWVPWTLTAYNIVGAVWTPIAGSMGDIFGVKWITLASLVVYLIGEIGCALAKDIFVLIAFRGVQGVGMGVFVLCFTAIKKTFPPRMIPIALGIVSSMFSVGTSFGFVVGAAIIKGLAPVTRWEYVFFVYVPFILVVIVAYYFTMENTERDHGRRVDYVGAAILSVAVIALLLGLTFSSTRGWTDAAVLALVIVGALMFGVFMVAELFVADPMVDPKLFFTRNLFVNALVALFVGFMMFGSFQVLPYLYQFNFKVTDAVTMGCMLLPIGLCQLPLTPFVVLGGKKIGFPNVITIALAGMTLALGLYVRYHNTKTQSILINILFGCCMGGVMSSLLNIVSQNCEARQFGSASGTNTLMRILGGAIGPVAVNLVLYKSANHFDIPVAHVVTSSSEVETIFRHLKTPINSGYTNSFIFMCCIAAGALFIAQFLGGRLATCRKPVDPQTTKATETSAGNPLGVELVSVVNVYPYQV
eukprot:m51a1_g1402 hypothetical protein (548) ;mRNA; r:496344-498332